MSSTVAALQPAMSRPLEPRSARGPTPPTTRRGAPPWQDWLFARMTMVFALFVLLTLVGIIGALAWAAIPAFEKFGLGFFVTNVWNPVKLEFGALAPVYGTLVTSAIALVIGVPVSFGIALFLTEMCPVVLKRPLGTAVELLAAIPSIIYGMWGLFVFAPFFGDHIQPVLTRVLGTLDQPHSVDTMAELAHMAPRTFARKFRNETGATPHDWLTHQRLLLARRLLEDSDLGVDAIAERSGFGSAATLRHHFTQRLSTTPQAYRGAFRSHPV